MERYACESTNKIIVGCKCDLVDQRAISIEEALVEMLFSKKSWITKILDNFIFRNLLKVMIFLTLKPLQRLISILKKFFIWEQDMPMIVIKSNENKGTPPSITLKANPRRNTKRNTCSISWNSYLLEKTQLIQKKKMIIFNQTFRF